MNPYVGPRAFLAKPEDQQRFFGRDAEQEKLRNQTEAYSEQAILLSDLLQQQASFASAEDQYRQALLGFWAARADFEKALGEE